MAAPDPSRVASAREGLARHGVAVLFEDNHLLLVGKPAGLLSQGGPGGEVSAVDVLAAYRREAEAKPGAAFVGLVHRLDRNVSGVLAVAKTSKAASRLAALFRERDPALEKEYLAWVAGEPVGDAGEARETVVRHARVTRVREEGEEGDDGREAHLTWTVEGRGDGVTRLSVRLLTGATHQIRAQLSARGLPLLGDAKYGGPAGPRPALHAMRLSLPHPVGAARVEVRAPVPDDLLRLDRRRGLRPPVA